MKVETPIRPSNHPRTSGDREPARGIFLLVLLVVGISGFMIHHTTLGLGWEKVPRFVAIMIGAPLLGTIAGVFHRYIKILLALYAIAAFVFIVGLLVWINI